MYNVKKRLYVGAFALITAIALTTPAVAASANISGTTSSASWVNYTQDRTSTLSTISFTPSNLLHQGGPVYNLNLRLNNTNNTPLSSSQSWTNYSNKNIMTGLATGTKFRMAACCYSAATGDHVWAGKLTY